jgi:predicted RNA-binding protein YlqC (UPF0109 family)
VRLCGAQVFEDKHLLWLGAPFASSDHHGFVSQFCIRQNSGRGADALEVDTPIEVHGMAEVELNTDREALIRSMSELVRVMAEALVDSPEGVLVRVETDGDSTVLVLRVEASDLGKVIGKQGRTARSMRTILGAASMKMQHRFALDIQQVDRGSTPSA